MVFNIFSVVITYFFSGIGVRGNYFEIFVPLCHTKNEVDIIYLVFRYLLNYVELYFQIFLLLDSEYKNGKIFSTHPLLYFLKIFWLYRVDAIGIATLFSCYLLANQEFLNYCGPIEEFKDIDNVTTNSSLANYCYINTMPF